MSSIRSSSERAAPLFAMLALGLAACSAGSAADDEGWYPDGDTGWGGTDTSGTDTAESDTGDDSDFDITLVAPAITENYVFIGLASQGAVVRVGIEDGLPRLVTTRLGFVPRSVSALGADEVVAISADGSRVAFVTAVVGASSDAVSSVEGLAGANRVSVDARSRFAFVWYDTALADASSNRPRPLGDMVAIDLDSRQTYALAVGLYIRGVEFSDDGSTAFVVSDEGVSVIDLESLAADGYFVPVPVTRSTTLGLGREVLLLADGAYAVARDDDSTTLTFTRLADGERLDIALSGTPGDLEPVDGGERVVYSLPDANALRFVDPVAVFAEGSGAFDEVELDFAPSSVEVSPDGATLLAWAAEADENTQIATVEVDGGATSYVEMRKGIVGAAFAPDGVSAVIFHGREQGEVSAGDPPEVIVARSWAYSLLRLADEATKLVLTQSRPTGVAFDETGSHAIVLLPDTGSGAADWARLSSFQTTTLRFAYPPEYAGTIPGTGTAFVVQTHPRGRIAFVTLATERIQEITGFELNALIE